MGVPVDPDGPVQTLGGLEEAGTYFVRLHDTNGRVLDSFGFIYVPGLSMAAPTDLPGLEGHVPLRVRLGHDPATVMRCRRKG